jgi:hypothetical protein
MGFSTEIDLKQRGKNWLPHLLKTAKRAGQTVVGRTASVATPVAPPIAPQPSHVLKAKYAQMDARAP